MIETVKPPSKVFAEQCKLIREARHLKQQDLADRLESIGLPMDRSAIAKIEASQRGITVDEVFAFAVALGVSPLALLVPRSDQRMSIAPAVEADVSEVVPWARNMRNLGNESGSHRPLMDGGDMRFFAEQVTDGEAEAYTRLVNLRQIIDLAGLLLAAAANPRLRKRGVPGVLAKLAQAVQRTWQDIGQPGTALESAEATTASLNSLTDLIYRHVGKAGA